MGPAVPQRTQPAHQDLVSGRHSAHRPRATLMATMPDHVRDRRSKPGLQLLLLTLAALVVAAVIAAWSVQAGASSTADVPAADAMDAADRHAHGVVTTDQTTRGAEAYAFSCAVCHGATGQGFAEAVSAFPEDHQDCSRCHQPQNSPTMPGSQVGLSTMAFSIGDPPPLADPTRLARFGTAGGLYHYVRATMPRWAPGSLDDAAYLDLSAHLLRMTGFLADELTLDTDDLDRLRLE